MRQLKITKQITGRESLSIEKYLQEIAKIDVLTAEEEVELARRGRLGDRKARERLVLCNLRFVVSVAKQYQNHGLTLGDLINEGNLGLIKAAETFDETKGFKFISYAVWWIRQTILTAMAEDARLIRLPLNRISTITRLNRCYAELEQKLQREPTADEVAELMQVTARDVEEHMKIAGRPLSMDAPLNAEEDTVSLYDVYVDSNPMIMGPEAELDRMSLKKDIGRSLSVLSEREVEILSMFYGLDGNPPITMEEIGVKMKLTGERVRQLKAKAIRKLKEQENNARLKGYL